MYICQYCGKEIGNKGCLVLHEKRCIKNPNRLISKTQAIKDERDSRRDKNGKLKYKSHKHTEETKQLLSQQRKQWLLEHKDGHVWRRDSKFLSIPCENLKKYLKDKGINFVEEYEPFDDINYCLDIAWPDEKIAIEVNGNQHYNRDGSLSKYYQKRHNLFEKRGWKIFEVHYTKCYNPQIEDFEDILKLPIYDKDYVGKYFSKKELKQSIKENKLKNKESRINIKRQILINAEINSNIDFSKFGWVTKLHKYLEERGELFDKMILRSFKKYYPEFFQNQNIKLRTGSSAA